MGGTRWKDDAALVRACRGGDQEAWRVLVQRYRRLIYSVPVNYRMAPAEADDVFQAVVVKLLEKLDQLRRAESLAAWIVTTARRECQGALRGSRRFDSIDEDRAAELVEPEVDLDAAIDATLSEHTLSLALERLDTGCRDLLNALYLEDPTPSYDELAARLSRPIGSLGPTRSRCLKKLRKFFIDLGGSTPG